MEGGEKVLYFPFEDLAQLDNIFFGRTLKGGDGLNKTKPMP